MQKSKFVHYLLLIIAVLCLASCEYDVVEFEEIVIPPTEEIKFSTHIIPIFNSKCVDCHNGAISPNLSPDKAYQSLETGNYLNSIIPSENNLYKFLTENDGHKPRTTQQEKVIIQEWIKLGAKND